MLKLGILLSEVDNYVLIRIREVFSFERCPLWGVPLYLYTCIYSERAPKYRNLFSVYCYCKIVGRHALIDMYVLLYMKNQVRSAIYSKRERRCKPWTDVHGACLFVCAHLLFLFWSVFHYVSLRNSTTTCTPGVYVYRYVYMYCVRTYVHCVCTYM